MSGVIAGLPIRVYVENTDGSESGYLATIAKNTTDLADRSAFFMSAATIFIVPSGANGSSVTPSDLGHNYKLLIISCADCSGIPASTSLAVQTGFELADTMCNLYEQDAPDTVWASGNLPTSGTMRFALTHAIGARRIRLILSQNATSNVIFTVYGVDGS